MTENQHIDIEDQFKKIKDKLFISSIIHKIEYLHYKKSIYVPEKVKNEYEETFFFFPYEEINSMNNIQIFHEFYTTDVWGSIGPMKIGDEKYNYSLHEIESRIKKPKSEYIIKKLREIYSNISSDIPGALAGFKISEKLPADYSEISALINLLNRYRKILSRPDIQLKIFNGIHLTKDISDLFTEILMELIRDRLKLLDPKIEKHKRKLGVQDLSEEFDEDEIIPLIKLNYKPDQQKQILQLIHKKLYPEYIDDSYEQFECHFIEKDIEFRKMVWKGSEREIAHLFKSLKDSKVILSLDQNKLIEIHFLNKKENPFKSKQLRVAYTKSPIETFPFIHQLVLDVKKLALAFN